MIEINATFNKLGKIKANRAVLKKVNEAIQRRVNKELGQISTMSERVQISNDYEKGSCTVGFRKEYLREKWDETPDEYQLDMGELISLLTKESASMVGKEILAGEDVTPILYLEDIVKRAIRDMKLKESEENPRG